MVPGEALAPSISDRGSRAITPRAMIVLGLLAAAAVLLLRGFRDRGPTAFRAPTIHISKSMSSPRSPDSLFLLMSDPDKFGLALPDTVQVNKLSPNRWRWNLLLPGGQTHVFGTSLVDARPPYHLRWRTSHRVVMPHEVSIDIFPHEDDLGSTVRIVWSLSPPFRLPLAPFPRQIERAADSLLERAVDRFSREYGTVSDDVPAPKPAQPDEITAV